MILILLIIPISCISFSIVCFVVYYSVNMKEKRRIDFIKELSEKNIEITRHLLEGIK